MNRLIVNSQHLSYSNLTHSKLLLILSACMMPSTQSTIFTSSPLTLTLSPHLYSLDMLAGGGGEGWVTGGEVTGSGHFDDSLPILWPTARPMASPMARNTNMASMAPKIHVAFDPQMPVFCCPSRFPHQLPMRPCNDYLQYSTISSS